MVAKGALHDQSDAQFLTDPGAVGKVDFQSLDREHHSMPDPSFDAELRRRLDEYERVVDQTDMTERTKNTYLLHVRNFVRWTRGDFEPGSRLRR